MTERKRKSRKVRPNRHQLGAFFERVTVNSHTGCWEWTGRKTPDGLPTFAECPKGPARLPRALPMAHRQAWAWFRGRLLSWPNWKLVQGCGDKGCVNPAHLEQRKVMRKLPPFTVDNLAAFMSQVQIGRDVKRDHWLWLGPLTRVGYGIAPAVEGYSTTMAHRVIYHWFTGIAPSEIDLHIDHVCEVRDCVNPLHLEAVTQAENLRRRPERRLARGMAALLQAPPE